MKVKLKETGKIITGNTPKTSEAENYSSNDIPFIKPSDIHENDILRIGESEYWISEHARKKARILPPNSVLVTCIGIIGKVAINTCECAFNQQINAIIPDSERYLPEYIAYAILSKQKYLQEIANAPVVPIINKSQFADIDIQTIDIQAQKRVVDKLSSVSELIKLNNYRLNKLDELIKSRFVEMFGDPETNPYSWNRVTLQDVCSSIVRGPFGSVLKKEFFVPKGQNTYKVYEQKHAIQKSATIGEYYITHEKFDELKRFECKADDFIMSCSGTMGELYQLPEGCERGVINQALCKFTLNERILPTVFLNYMKSTIGNLETKGSGIKNIAAVSYVKALPINLPPLKVQQEFSDFVTQVEKQKATVQQSIDKLEILKKSLMQEYFG